MVKNWKQYNEGLQIDKPFDQYPINVMPTYFGHNKELISQLKSYYDKFIGRRVTFEGSFLKPHYNVVQRENQYGTFTIRVKRVKYHAMGAEAPKLYFSDGLTDYDVRKILSSQGTKKLAKENDPYGEEDWYDNEDPVNENFDYEEEEEPDNEYDVVIFNPNQITLDSFYIVQEVKNNSTLILLNDFEHNVGGADIWQYCRYATEKDLQEYIYSNRYPLLVNEKNKDPRERGGDLFKKYYWKDLPKWIKEKL